MARFCSGIYARITGRSRIQCYVVVDEVAGEMRMTEVVEKKWTYMYIRK